MQRVDLGRSLGCDVSHGLKRSNVCIVRRVACVTASSKEHFTISFFGRRTVCEIAFLMASPDVAQLIASAALALRRTDAADVRTRVALALRLGAAFEHGGQEIRAARSFGLAVKLGGGTEAYMALGMVLGRLQRAEQAREAFLAARALSPGHAPTHRALALAESFLGRPEHAAEALGRAVRLMPTYEDAHFELGLVHQRLERPHAALAAYDALLAHNGRHAGALTNRGTVLKELSRAHEAHAAYLRALLVAPTMGEIYNNLAVLATGELRLPELALRHIQDGRRLSPSIDWETPQGLALSQLRRYSEAAAALAAAARAAPSSEGAACQLAIARMRIADWRDVDGLMHRARTAIERGA